MIVYNIRRARYAGRLTASGVANRWNREDEFIVYTGGSIALSTLELVAHRSATNLNTGYKLLFIDLAVDQSDVTEIQLASLPANWRSVSQYPALQEIGSRWYQQKSSLLLKVPSASIPWEHNFLINTTHPDFSLKVSLSSVEDFEWDGRLL